MSLDCWFRAPLCELDIHEYLLQRLDTNLESFLKGELFKKEYQSYNFLFTYGDLDFLCKIDWGRSGRYFKVSLDDDTLGVAEGIQSIRNYLFNLSEEIVNEKKAFTRLCREIRRFEAYYYNSINKYKSQTTTPTEVLMLQNEMIAASSKGNYIKVIDIVDHFQLDIPICNEGNKDKYIEFHDLFDYNHDLYGYMDVEDIKSYIYWCIENNAFEKFNHHTYKRLI